LIIIASLPQIPKGYADNGLSFIIVPAFSEVHTEYAKGSVTYEGLFNTPLVGWISGCHLEDLENTSPKVYNGQTGESFSDQCIVMHTSLPAGIHAKIDIVNIFSNDESADVLHFSSEGNVVSECTVNGESKNFVDYLHEKEINTQLPLQGDFMGEQLNISIQAVDEEKKTAALYAPVFPGIDYRFAKPIGDYAGAFAQKLDAIQSVEPVFSCNCILNYLYGELEGKATGHITGPMTFGEIAYMLLNQTMVYVTYVSE
jgi:hypothetical protein